MAAVTWEWIRISLTFNAVCLAWCFFRLTHLDDSLACVRKWIDFDLGKAFAGGGADPAVWLLLGGYGVAAFGVHLLSRCAPLPDVAARMDGQPLTSGMLWGISLGLLVLALLLAPGAQVQPFIYFQF